jgi:hypothetical protein
MGIFRDILSAIFSTGAQEKIDEGVFDTDVFKEFSNKYKNVKFPKLSEEEKEDVDSMLAEPCAMPYEEDGTLEAWLLRISLWGKIKITHKNPEDGTNRTMTNQQFLDYIGNEEVNEMYGKWKVEEAAINKIRNYREFWGINGKNNVEEIIVDIDLRPDLKKKLKQIGRY